MGRDFATPPLRAGNTVLGSKEAEVLPFEPAGIDFASANEIRRRDPTYGQNVVPDAIVGSCSACCMAEINGKPNLLGRMHKRLVGGCGHCPVGMAGDHVQARGADGEPLFVALPDGTRRPMTQTELMYMELDGTE